MKNRMTLIGIVTTLLFTGRVHAADTFTIDPAHTRIGFSARHFGIMGETSNQYGPQTSHLVAQVLWSPR